MRRLSVQVGRLLLDRYAVGDRRDLYAVRYHPSVRQFTSNPSLTSYRSHLAWVRENLLEATDLHLWLVRLNPAARAIGFAQLKLNTAGDGAEIGVMFRQANQHPLSAALTTAVTLYVAYTYFACTWITSYVVPSHQHAIDFNKAWGGTIVDSDRPGLVCLKMHRDVCQTNARFRRIMTRIAPRLRIIPMAIED